MYAGTTTVCTRAIFHKAAYQKPNLLLDVKEAKNGHKYLTITQSSIRGGQKFRNSLIVFGDQLEAFSQIFAEAKQKTI